MNITPHYISGPVITKAKSSLVGKLNQPSLIELRVENEYGIPTKRLTITNTEKHEKIDTHNKGVEKSKSTDYYNPKNENPSILSTKKVSQQKSNAVDFNEKQEIKDLVIRDQQVRSHEIAHASVGGSFTGSPTYSFTTGPDGKKYATNGEVSVDLSIEKDNHRGTITKMQKVYAAALAPANPSIKDTYCK